MSKDYDYHNGVVCKACFKTIDLTTIDKERIEDQYNLRRRFLDARIEDFQVICPYCEYPSRYAYTEVKELLPLEWRKQEAKIRKLQAEVEEKRIEGTIMAAKLKELSGEPESTLVDSTNKPKNIKKDDPKELPYN